MYLVDFVEEERLKQIQNEVAKRNAGIHTKYVFSRIALLEKENAQSSLCEWSI